MVLPRFERICAAVALTLLLASAVAPAVARPPPRPFCDGCGDSFAETAASRGVDITVTESTAVVQVHDNGSATWTVHNHVADSDGLDQLRTNATLRDTVADRAMWDATLRSTSVSADGVVTARYREPDFATESVGVLRSGAFTESAGYANLDGLGADELTVVAPDGTRVEAAVPGATVSDDGSRMTLTEFTDDDEGEFVTFAPRDAKLGGVRSTVAIWSGKATAVYEDIRWLIPIGSVAGVDSA